jgi:hypothetical protein
MTDPIRQVEEWYKRNARDLVTKFMKVEFVKKSWDVTRGGVVIEIEGSTVSASLAFWNKGDISIYALKKGTDKPLILDDRVLIPGEDISKLLDSYLREIENMA